MESLKNILEHANSDKTFVQLQPCTEPECKGNEYVRRDLPDQPKLWPNPSVTSFHLKVPFNEADGPIEILVFDRYNSLVYTTTGQASDEFSFGDNLPSGLYFVRIEQGNQRMDVKAIKK